MAGETQFKSDLTIAQYAIDLSNGRIALVDGALKVRVLVGGYSADGHELAGKFLYLDLLAQEETDIKAAFQPALQRLKTELENLGLTEFVPSN